MRSDRFLQFVQESVKFGALFFGQLARNLRSLCLSRHPDVSEQHLQELGEIKRLGHMGNHPGVERRLAVLRHDAGSQGDDGRAAFSQP